MDNVKLGYLDQLGVELPNNDRYITDYIKIPPNMKFNHNFEVLYFYDSNKKFIIRNTDTSPSNCMYVRGRGFLLSVNPANEYYIGSNANHEKTKATLMYRNSSNELVPIPTLRGKWQDGRFLWGDEVLEHDDGKLYYHKRTYLKKFTDGLSWYDDYNAQLGENLISFAYDADTNIKVGTRICSDKYNEITSSTVLEGLFPSGSKNGIRIKINKSKCTDLKSLDTYIRNNNFSVVVELSKEEVYPCELSEQLYSFDGETNIFINGGAVVGETVIEVGTKLGPIVAEIKQETKIVTDGLKGVLAGDMQELAYQLYPDDFNKDTVEMKPIKSVE